MKPEKKSGTQLGFSKNPDEKHQRQRATQSVYRSLAVKQRSINLSISTGEEDTRWTSWVCVMGTRGQRELKSGAFKIQLLRQKGNFCLNTAAITLENEGFPPLFDLSKLISFSCVKKKKKQWTKLRCTVEWGSYWWHLRLGMPNYTHECLIDVSGAAPLIVPFRQTAMHRSWMEITTWYMSNVGQGWFPGWGVHYISELPNFDSLKSSCLICANRGSCSISYCITKSERAREKERDGGSQNVLTTSASLYLYT